MQRQALGLKDHTFCLLYVDDLDEADEVRAPEVP